MSARTDKLELECRISELQSELLTCNSQLRTANNDCEKIAGKIQHATARLQHHVNNRKHMRSAADHVDIEEYKSTLQSIRHFSTELDALQYEAAIFHKNRSTILKQISESEVAIERKKALLKDYGRVLQFPSK